MLARKSLSQNRIAIFMAVIAIVWVVIGVIVYRNYFAKPKPTVPKFNEVPVISDNKDTKPVKSGALANPVNITPSFLQDLKLTGLQVYGEVPLQVGETGRSNPFEPVEATPSSPAPPGRR
jgi:hypothetical protein